MNDDTIVLLDNFGRKIRLTRERSDHILEHPEMAGQFDKIRETLIQPEIIVATTTDNLVHVYH
jgi:hypothetical protein